MSHLKLVNVNKYYGKTKVLHDINIELQGNPFVVFVGPSGCGKSTLLRIIAGLEKVTSGDILIDDAVVTEDPPVDRDVSMVFQSYALYPQMTVADNMSFGLRMANVDAALIAEKVSAAAQQLQLDLLLQRKPKDLSGGQRQRVAIGRSIVRNPKLFLFDEPLSNLDAELRVEMRIRIAQLHKSLGATIIYVTHDQVEAMTLAEKIVVIKEGRIEQIGSPIELYERPCNQFVAGFIGSPKMNFIQTYVTKADSHQSHLQLTNATEIIVEHGMNALKKNDEVILGIRPEHIHIQRTSAQDIQLDAQIDFQEILGALSFLYCNTQQLKHLTVQQLGYGHTQQGDSVSLYFSNKGCHLFDSKSGKTLQ